MIPRISENFGGWTAHREIWVSLLIGRVFAVVAVIMVLIWASNTNTEEKYLGGLQINDNRKKVFNFHPPAMVISMLLCMGLSLTSFRDGWSFKISKRLHLSFNLLAKVFMVIGLRAAYIYRDEPQGDNSKVHYQHFATMHSWIGLTTSLILFQQDFFGGVHFLYPKLLKVPRYVVKVYRDYHIFFGKLAFVMAGVAMVTGIVARNEQNSCTTTVSTIDRNPFDGYQHIPPGCRLSNGLGIVIIISVFFIIFGLRHPLAKSGEARSSILTSHLSSEADADSEKHLSFNEKT